LAGGAFADQAGALDVAAHGAQVAMAGVAHNVFVADAFVVGFGDKADAQRVRAQPVELVHRQPGHLLAMRQDSPNRIGMQRGVADPIPGAHFSKERAGLAPRHRLPGLEGADRTGFDMAPTRQADLSPLPCPIGLSPNDAQAQPGSTAGRRRPRRAGDRWRLPRQPGRLLRPDHDPPWLSALGKMHRFNAKPWAAHHWAKCVQSAL
jgi:hypothetical protein